MQNEIKESIQTLVKEAKGVSLLYVEDEKELQNRMLAFFSKIFTRIDTADDGKEALEKYQKNHYDIIITDIVMPKMDGLELIKHIHAKNNKQEIIITSAYSDLSYLMESIKLGITGYLIKPLDFQDIIGVLEQSIDKINLRHENETYKKNLEHMLQKRSSEVLELKNRQILNYEYAINSFVKMIERRDTYTGGHSERVARYSRLIAQELGLSVDECDTIYQAGILHDIGKIITPDSILLKPGKLTENEYALIQEHVAVGYEILSEVPMYKHLAHIVHTHHERYDGSGYPKGLKGKEIPLAARIMILADTFDAMTTSRIYKVRKSVSEALKEIKKLSGIWYDPDIIESATKVLSLVDIDKEITQDPNNSIEDERFAYFFKDPLTGVYNHNYLDFILHKKRDEKSFLCFHIIYIKKFSAYNKEHGWSEGDIFLSSFGTYLLTEFKDSQVFRIFGDDFLILNETHKEIDIEKINASPLLQKNKLHCESKHIDLHKSIFNSYRDLQDNK